MPGQLAATAGCASILSSDESKIRNQHKTHIFCSIFCSNLCVLICSHRSSYLPTASLVLRGRKTDRIKAVASAPDSTPAVETVGVGIVLKPSFQSDTFLALVVHSLVPGSSAEQSRMIQSGDILHTINDADVYRRPANEVCVRELDLSCSPIRI